VVAVREFTLEKPHGRVDYLLFLNGQPAGVIEAKPEGTPLVEVENHRTACQGLRPGSGIDLSSLIPSLIHPRTTRSIRVDRESLSRGEDRSDPSQTVILKPEKRKVGGSIPPLTTSSDLARCPDSPDAVAHLRPGQSHF
jgi:hypothetical protein